MNLLLFSLLPIQIFKHNSAIFQNKVLYEYVFMLMSSIRVIGVFAILVFGWLRRYQMRVLLSQVNKLVVKTPHIKNVIRSRVLLKIVCAFLTEVMHIYVAYLFNTKVEAIYAFILVGISASIINLVTSQLCLISLIISTQHELLNAEMTFTLHTVPTNLATKQCPSH
ncbi:putative gustatory receptor 36b [Drosophila tropicalis]|uniref:putative gustatory receptor 36b n=1 Tax=Drosophila tropicalis TaxID=46794 RepID=UPI0035ABA3E6